MYPLCAGRWSMRFAIQRSLWVHLQGKPHPRRQHLRGRRLRSEPLRCTVPAGCRIPAPVCFRNPQVWLLSPTFKGLRLRCAWCAPILKGIPCVVQGRSCRNDKGGHVCGERCRAGYFFDEKIELCTDFDECAHHLDNCPVPPPHQFALNQYGQTAQPHPARVVLALCELNL